jgi:hypothetical protein
MKDLGSLQYFFDIEVAYPLRDYLLSQSKYVVNILERAKLTDNKTVNTFIKINTKYSYSDSLSLSGSTLYHSIVDILIYLTITCPDITYIVHVVGKLVFLDGFDILILKINLIFLIY